MPPTSTRSSLYRRIAVELASGRAAWVYVAI